MKEKKTINKDLEEIIDDEEIINKKERDRQKKLLKLENVLTEIKRRITKKSQ